MKLSPSISGVLPVLHMPYLDSGAIDYNTLCRETDHVFNAGADGIVIALASELLRLTHEERLEVTRQLPELAAGRGTTTMSVGAESTRQAVEYAEAAQKAGCDAVMAVPPFLTGMSADEKIKYYRAIHDAINIPVVVQDASGYMGGETIPVDQLAAMRRELDSRIYYKPEGLPTGPMLTALQKQLNNEGVIFEGSGGYLLIDSWRRGVCGTMSGCDLIEGIVAVWRALENGDEKRAYEVYLPLAALVLLEIPNLDTYLAIEKHLLKRQGIFKNTIVREPVAYILDDYTRAEVDRLYDRLQAVLAE